MEDYIFIATFSKILFCFSKTALFYTCYSKTYIKTIQLIE